MMMGLRLERGGDLAIDLVLLLLGRQIVAVDEQKFRAEQAHALRAVGNHGFDVVLVFNVGGEMDGLAVEGDGGLVPDFAEFFLQGRLDFCQLAIGKQRLVGRVDDDGAVVTVQQRVVAAVQFLADGLQTDDGGNAQRPRHDGGVRGFAADVRGKAQHQFLVQLRGGGRAEVVADQDARFGEVMQVEGVLHLQQIVQHARRQVAHVGGALAEIFIVGREERLGVTLGNGVKGEFDVDLLLLDQADGFAHQGMVFEHQQMRLENVRLLRAQIFHHLALHLQDLLAGLDQRLFKPTGLPGHFVGRNLTLGDDVAGAMQHEDFPAANAVGNSDAPKNLLALW